MGERWGRQWQRSFDDAVQCEDQFVRLADNSDEQMIGGDDGEIATEPKPIIYRKANVSNSLFFFFFFFF